MSVKALMERQDQELANKGISSDFNLDANIKFFFSQCRKELAVAVLDEVDLNMVVMDQETEMQCDELISAQIFAAGQFNVLVRLEKLKKTIIGSLR